MTRSHWRGAVRGSFIVTVLGILSTQLVASCVQQHEGPKVSDTATNWLRICSKRADCGGALSCIEHVCTQACPSSAESDCGALSPLASCEQGDDGASARCDLSCSSDQVCADFRVGYVCTEGLCRQDAKAATSASGASRSSGVELLPVEGPLLLSDRDRIARSPVVEARGDSWRVVWATDAVRSEEPVEPRIEVADIAADTSVSTRGMVHESDGEGAGLTLVQGGPGQVAYLETVGRTGGLCQLRIVATAGPELRDAFDFECGGAIGVAPISGSEDWLVGWDDGGTNPGLELGRYRAGDGDWRAGAWDLKTLVLRGQRSFAAFGGDAWLAFGAGNGARYLRVAGVAAPEPADPTLPLPAPIAASQAQYQVLVGTPGGALAFYSNGGSLQSLLITGTKATEASLAPSRSAGGSSGWKTMGAVRVAERERTFVCYQGAFGESDQVAIVAVDDRGRRIGEPIAVSDEGVYMVSCSLAWSGDALLATWNDFKTPRPGASTYSVVEARIISLP